MPLPYRKRKDVDPLTAGLNAFTAVLNFIGKIIDKAPADTVGSIISKHEERADKLWDWLGKLPGSPFK
jgi:hypothetical protein